MAMQHQHGSAPDAYRWWVLVTVVFGAFASILDSTIVNTALPRIQHDFGADLHLASYVATAYILAAGVLVPATGYLANRFGTKRVYIASLVVFTFGSALCGLAPSIGWLIAFRILQGAGGAALFPLSFALLFSVFTGSDRGRANGIFGIPVLVAPALGPSLGGYLTQYVDWRWVFYVNLPVGIVGVIMAARILREQQPDANRQFDIPGFLLAAFGLGLLLFGLSNLAYDGWQSTGTVSGPILVSLLLLGTFVPVELRARHPLLHLRLYARRSFLLATLIVLPGVVGLLGPAFLLPQYLQVLRQETPFVAGMLLLWQGIGSVLGTITSGQVYNRVGPRRLIFAGLILVALTSLWLALWSTSTANLLVLPFILFIRGIGLPLVMQSTNTVLLEGINGPLLPEATTLNVVGRNVMGSLGIALLTNYLQDRTNTYVSNLGPAVAGAAHSVARTVGAAMSTTHLPPAVLNAQASAYHDTYLVVTISILPAFVAAALVKSSVGRASRSERGVPVEAVAAVVPGNEIGAGRTR
jgi:EmrB/QacA subfamily drug resistance transporter